MRLVLLIAAGGAIGAVLRYFVSTGIHALLGKGFPYGTLTVNVVGSLAIGVLFIIFVERLNISPEWRALVIIGLLGAFTTFSTFSMETFYMIEDSAFLKAFANIFINVSVCLIATWIGVIIGRQI